MDRELGPEYSVGTVERDELPFVFRSWCRGYRACPESLRMPARAFFGWHRGVIDQLLGRGALVLVARDAESPVYLYGFLVAERLGDAVCVHWTHVRKDWRLRGVARSLLDDAIERLGNGATRLAYTHSAIRHVRSGQPQDARLERRLRAAGFELIGIEAALRGEAVRDVA